MKNDVYLKIVVLNKNLNDFLTEMEKTMTEKDLQASDEIIKKLAEFSSSAFGPRPSFSYAVGVVFSTYVSLVLKRYEEE